MVAVAPGPFCTHHRSACVFHPVCFCLLLLWSPEMSGLSDFSNYLFRIINSHSVRVGDGDALVLSCPRHSSISIRSASYGHHGPHTPDCRASTALQKMLSECQGRRSCQVLVHHRQFGRDPCPDTLKHLDVSYSCKPTEHRNKTGCEGEQVLLHCKAPRLLNIYSTVYGREPDERDVCVTAGQPPPPYECLHHGALDLVRRECYGRQRCFLAVDDAHFTNPCPLGTRKYLRVLYSCVPQTIFKQADPDFFRSTADPRETAAAEERPQVRDSRLPEQVVVIISNSLTAFVFIKEHPEMAGLLFMSSVCVGLLVVLLTISTRLTCTRRPKPPACLRNSRGGDDDSDEDQDESDPPLTDRSWMAEDGGKLYRWEDAAFTTEAAELMERLERRELLIQEIRMNAYLNGNSGSLP